MTQFLPQSGIGERKVRTEAKKDMSAEEQRRKHQEELGAQVCVCALYCLKYVGFYQIK